MITIRRRQRVAVEFVFALLTLLLAGTAASKSVRAAGAELISNSADEIDLAGTPYFRQSGLLVGGKR